MAEKPKGQDVRADIRKPEVEDLLCVLAQLDDADTIFALLEDLFTIREIRETSQRLAVARLLDPSRPKRELRLPPLLGCPSASPMARAGMRQPWIS